jgi:hypothetical protein
MHTYGGVEVQLHTLTTALEGCEQLASRPGHLPPREKKTGSHWTGDWVGPRAGVDVVAKRKILPCLESIPFVQPVAYELITRS